MRHELLLLALGAATTLALIAIAGPGDPTTIETLTVSLLLLATVSLTKRSARSVWQKLRFFAAYLFVLWFYAAIESIVPALRDSTYDAELMAIDQQLFGVTPAVWMQAWCSTGLNECMSGCYLSYLVYLHVCLVHAAILPVESAKRLVNWLFSVYAIGLGSYLLFPAIGPGKAFADSFPPPIDGPWLTPLNRFVVEHGSSVYDAFPSLHVLITCTLMDHDRRYHPRRFYAMLVPVAGLFVSTLYLRYHYAIDLIAGGVLFAVALICFRERTVGGVEAGNVEQ